MPTYTLRCLLVSQARKQDSDKHLLNSFERIDNSSGEHFCKTITCMLLGPQAVEESKQEITLDTEAGVIWMSSNGSTCLAAISGRTQLVESRDDIDEKFLANNSALSLVTFSREPLLSDWPEHLIKRVDRPTPPLDPEILKNVTMRQFVGYAPNPKTKLRNQVFYFLDVLRVSMHNHLCQREFCIACELGFLFYMLDVADGQTCQASNFLRTFRTLPEASALGLLVNENMSVSCNRSISQTIQNWNRFVLRQLHQITFRFECSSDIKDLFGMDIISNRTCKCGMDSERKATLFSIDLSYPEVTDSDTDDVYPFVKILNESIVRKQSTQAWCESCKKYQYSTQFRKVISVPPVLNINCRLDNAKEISFWRKQQEPKFCRYGKFCNRQGCRFVHQGREGEKLLTPPGSEVDETINEKSKHWLPTLIQVKHNKETQEVKILRHDEESNEAEGIVYRLISNVCHIYDSSFGSTLVAHIKVGKQYHLIKEGKEQDHWYLFNDFAIAPISENEAVTFNLSWKVPCILMYARQDIDTLHNIEIKQKFDSSLLFAERSLATRQARFSRNFTPLNSTEILKEGDIVGVDAEFVTLNQEESEMRRDGTLSTLRPSQMSVARITVVRGWGPLTGVPFIDDYISTSEQVVDYLTKFSGIKPGDLDASMSSKHLTTLKLAYQKLRYLIAQKVVFIGHGLKKDFRVINLVIPRDQVVDTVELFHIPKQRYVSLKFLAWHFLNIKIQADCHDSAEDAYTALKLYEKYRELLRAGEWVLEEELEILYDTGRQYNWQVPE
uniref:PAB-dependent poly(A)-specific ribonuclease subunit 2 n=1 Tax=Hydra vulgaris TaxID=6087 RepID=T2MCW3_HYDVU